MAEASAPPTDSTSRVVNQRSNKKRILLIVLAILLVAIVASYVFRNLFHGTDTRHLPISGRLEGYETNLSAKIGGRIDSISVREGDRVIAGQLLAQLSDADYQAQLQGAKAHIERAQHLVLQKQDQLIVLEAQIAAAEKRVKQAREESNAQIEQAQAAVSQSQARLQQAQSDLMQASAQLNLSAIRLQRYTNLVKKGAVTKDEYDQARTTHDSDAANLASRQAAVTAAQKAVQEARATFNQQKASRFTPPIRQSDVSVIDAQRSQACQDVKAAQEDVASAIAERDQIQANINYLRIKSPITGIVTARPVEPGAVLTPGQTLLTVLDFRKVYMRAFVPEGQIGKVRIKQKAQIFLDSFPNKSFSGTVSEIDPEASFTPENIYFKDDRVKQVFGIKVNIDEPGGYAKPGMPADAQLEL